SNASCDSVEPPLPLGCAAHIKVIALNPRVQAISISPEQSRDPHVAVIVFDADDFDIVSFPIDPPEDRKLRALSVNRKIVDCADVVLIEQLIQREAIDFDIVMMIRLRRHGTVNSALVPGVVLVDQAAEHFGDSSQSAKLSFPGTR